MQRVNKLVIPAPHTEPAELFDRFYGDTPDFVGELGRITIEPVFRPLSLIPIQSYPARLLDLLPLAESSDFLEQALGLHLLLDQATRLVLKRHNVRWCYGFFGPLATQLAQDFETLPQHLRPDRMSRWMEELGYSWQEAALRATIFETAFVHSESVQDNAISTVKAEEFRKDIERITGMQDPSRTAAKALAMEHEVDALPRLVMADLIPPVYFSRDSFQDFFWFDMQINRVHQPILETFGRYPWRNAALGRDLSQEENAYMLSIRGFADVDQAIARDIRNDAQNGIWRPLTS
ncbi:hypothetical protein EMMF5_004688 [Cystobasidiomycetes sp. EMM_F5]